MSRQQTIQKQKKSEKDYSHLLELSNKEKKALKAFEDGIEQNILPQEFIMIFTNVKLENQLERGYEVLKKKTKMTPSEMKLYLTGAAIYARYNLGTITRCMPQELKDAVKAASGHKGAEAKKRNKFLREIAHDGGVGGSSKSKEYANVVGQVTKIHDKISKSLGDGNGDARTVSLKIKTKDIDVDDCVSLIKEAKRENKDIEVFGQNGGYISLKRGKCTRLIPAVIDA